MKKALISFFWPFQPFQEIGMTAFPWLGFEKKLSLMLEKFLVGRTQILLFVHVFFVAVLGNLDPNLHFFLFSSYGNNRSLSI